VGQGSIFLFTLPFLSELSLNQTDTGTFQTNRNLFGLSKTDKEYLFNFAEKLKSTEFYAISEIKQILKQIDENKDSDIYLWNKKFTKQF